jgi:cell fate (sporulation/competence/biofilm development) regulator YlbF (YheA/YmcA/DUF963 family)
MIPNKELQDFARALKQTEEYTLMIKHRSKIMSDPMTSRQMMAFEREQARLIQSNIPETDMATRMKQLHTQYKALMDKEDVKNFLAAAGRYQKMIADSFVALNRALETGGQNRQY